MSYVDIILLIPLIWGLYKGFSRGIILEIASLIALFGGVYLAYHFYIPAGELIAERFEVSSEYLPILSFALVFVLVIMVIFALAKIAQKVFNLIALGWLNKLAGAVFGVLRMVFILSVILLLIHKMEFFEKWENKQKEQSLLYGPVASVAPEVLPILQEIDLKNLMPEGQVEEDEETIL